MRSKISPSVRSLKLHVDVSMPLHLIPLLIDRGFLIITEFAIFASTASDISAGNSRPSKHGFPQIRTAGDPEGDRRMPPIAVLTAQV